MLSALLIMLNWWNGRQILWVSVRESFCVSRISRQEIVSDTSAHAQRSLASEQISAAAAGKTSRQGNLAHYYYSPDYNNKRTRRHFSI